MTELSTSDILHNLLRTLDREMVRNQLLEDDSSSELTAAFFQGIRCGLAFAAGSITSHLDSLEEASE